MLSNKLKTLPQLLKALKRLKRKNKRIVFTNGCFDILHMGHIAYLTKAKSLGDVLVIGLNSDSSVRRLKGKNRPVVKEKNRAMVLSALEFIDFIVIFSNLTPFNLIKAIKPDVLVKGGDWKVKDIVGSGIVKSYGGKVKSLAYMKGFSTKGLIKRIKSS